jgi:hypothetical protein
MYRILLERAAEKDLCRLSFEIHDRVIVAIQALVQTLTAAEKITELAKEQPDLRALWEDGQLGGVAGHRFR